MSEYAKCYTATNPKAMKRHRCCECRGWIEKGEKYHVFSGIWDEPMRYKTCTDCEIERGKYIKEKRYKAIYCDYPSFESLYEGLYDWPDEDFLRVVNIMKKRRDKMPAWVEEIFEERKK